MRVISQDGKINIDYSTTAFALSTTKDCTKIIAYVPHHIFTMARYSNEDIAQKAMDRLMSAGFNNALKSTFLQENEL